MGATDSKESQGVRTHPDFLTPKHLLRSSTGQHHHHSISLTCAFHPNHPLNTSLFEATVQEAAGYAWCPQIPRTLIFCCFRLWQSGPVPSVCEGFVTGKLSQNFVVFPFILKHKLTPFLSIFTWSTATTPHRDVRRDKIDKCALHLSMCWSSVLNWGMNCEKS